MEKLTYTHNDAAAKALAAFYETPPLAYVRSYGCQQNVNDGEKIKSNTPTSSCSTPALCVSTPSSAFSAMSAR